MGDRQLTVSQLSATLYSVQETCFLGMLCNITAHVSSMARGAGAGTAGPAAAGPMLTLLIIYSERYLRDMRMRTCYSTVL